jgi:predicted ATPase/DNA-binding CsgD family transcriptional regulator
MSGRRKATAKPLRTVAGKKVDGSTTATPKHTMRGNLPLELSSFVGREREILEVERLLAKTRLLTLTGTGGCGKSRLAIKVAGNLVEEFEDGVWWVGLAPLADPALVPKSVASALDVREQPGRSMTEALCDHLRPGNPMLVLDNCEHLIEACAVLVETLLLTCPGLSILTTSREPLGVPGETVWTVPPLSLPEPDRASTVEHLMRCGAARLFVDRARSRLPAFELTEKNAASTARVCRILDGIPLAIELASARMGTLAVEQIAARLEDSLGLLDGGARTMEARHQTMRAALQWSHELLSEPEQELFARLSVFAGGWTLSAAEEVCRDAVRNDIVNLLGKLVDKSLVLAEKTTGDEARYRMLEPVRQYARERLEETGGGDRVRERHARYYLALAERAEQELGGTGQVAWLERLATEFPNLRISLSWCFEGGGAKPEARADLGLRLGAALGQFWVNRGSSEGREWLEKGLARSDAAPAFLQAKALNEAGFLATFQLDTRATAMLEKALALYKELEDRTGQATSLNYLMYTMWLPANLGRVPALREEALALLEGSPEDQRATAHLRLTLGMIAFLESDPGQVEAQMREALALFRKKGDLVNVTKCLSMLGLVALGRGDAEGAARPYVEFLQLSRLLKSELGAAFALIGAAGIAVLRDQPARAARLFGAAEAVRKTIGHPNPPLKQLNYDYEDYIAATYKALGETAFEAAFAEGRAMSAEQAIDFALEEPKTKPDHPSRTLLSAREVEVLSFAAGGLTDVQIAERLHLSRHTVGNHLSSVYRKLKVQGRTAAVHRAGEMGLF